MISVGSIATVWADGAGDVRRPRAARRGAARRPDRRDPDRHRLRRRLRGATCAMPASGCCAPRAGSLAQPSAIVAGTRRLARSTSCCPSCAALAADRARRLLPGPADADRAEPGPPLPVAVRRRADPDRAARAGAAPAAGRRHRPRAGAAADVGERGRRAARHVVRRAGAGRGHRRRRRSTAAPVPAACRRRSSTSRATTR